MRTLATTITLTLAAFTLTACGPTTTADYVPAEVVDTETIPSGCPDLGGGGNTTTCLFVDMTNDLTTFADYDSWDLVDLGDQTCYELNEVGTPMVDVLMGLMGDYGPDGATLLGYSVAAFCPEQSATLDALAAGQGI